MHFVSLTGQKIVYVMDVNKLGNVVTRIFENAGIFYYLLRRQQGKNHWGSYSIGIYINIISSGTIKEKKLNLHFVFYLQGWCK